MGREDIHLYSGAKWDYRDFMGCKLEAEKKNLLSAKYGGAGCTMEGLILQHQAFFLHFNVGWQGGGAVEHGRVRVTTAMPRGRTRGQNSEKGKRVFPGFFFLRGLLGSFSRKWWRGVDTVWPWMSCALRFISQ